MSDMKATKLKKIDEDKLYISWANGEEFTLTLEYIRDNCPCAQCTSEGDGKSPLEKWVQNSLKEHRSSIEKLELVGNYAVRPVWKDGHDVGIYRWEYLYELCNNFEKNQEEK